MNTLYVEFFYRHPVWEMLLWGVGLVLLWIVLSLLFHPWADVWKWINCSLLFLVIAFILWRTVGNRNGGKRDVCLFPFYSFAAAKTTSERYRSLVANILLFIPFGLTLPFCVRRYPVQTTILSAMGFSVLVEFSQYLFGLGLCETDDVIFNTLGAAFGSLAFLLFRCLNHDNDR